MEGMPARQQAQTVTALHEGLEANATINCLFGGLMQIEKFICQKLVTQIWSAVNRRRFAFNDTFVQFAHSSLL